MPSVRIILKPISNFAVEINTFEPFRLEIDLLKDIISCIRSASRASSWVFR